MRERENTNAKCFACQHMWKIVHHLTALFGMANRLVRDECGMGEGGWTSDVFCVHDFPAPIRPPALLDSLRIIRPSSEHARIISSGRGCCVGAMHWQDMTAQDQAPLLRYIAQCTVNFHIPQRCRFTVGIIYTWEIISRINTLSLTTRTDMTNDEVDCGWDLQRL